MQLGSLSVSPYARDPYQEQREKLLTYGQYEWTTIYEDYMPWDVLAFTTLKNDIHLPREPRHYALNVIKHEKAHNDLMDNPFVVRPDGSHDEHAIDYHSRNYPMYG